MSEISCSQDGQIDILSPKGVLDDTVLEKLAYSISILRQQGSRRILLLGHEIERIQTPRLEELTLPIRIFRGTGGIIAIAEFSDGALRQLRAVSWHRHLNVFQSKEEALQFLKPTSDH